MQLIAHSMQGHDSATGSGAGLLRLNNDDFILKTCELWADRLIAAGKQYCKVIVVTEDSGMLAKAKHDGKVSALRVRELPSSRDTLKELMFDRGLLEGLSAAKTPIVNPLHNLSNAANPAGVHLKL